MSANTSHTQIYTVIKTFEARLPDELTIREGDLIDLISDDSEFDDGWYMGKNLITNEVGLYPKVFTKIKIDSNDLQSSRPSLLRSRSRRTPQGSPITPTAPSYFENYANNTNNNNGENNLHPNNSIHSNISNRSRSNLSTPKGVNRYVNDIDQALKELKIDNNGIKKNNLIQNSNININNQNDPLNPINCLNWNSEQVCEYFSSFIDYSIAHKFIEHKISGNILLELELSYLKELDISSFGTRFEIYKEIENLRELSGITNTNINNNNNNSNFINPNLSNLSTSSFMNMNQNLNKSDLNLSKHIGNSNLRQFSQSSNNNESLFGNNDYRSNDPSLTVKTRHTSSSNTNTNTNLNSNRFSYSQSNRPQSVILDRPSRFSKSSQSSSPFPNQIPQNQNQISQSSFEQNNSPHDSQFDLQDVYEEKSIDNSSPINNDIVNEQFISPRKAPKPPNYPSPVSNNPTKFGIRSPIEETFSNIPVLSNAAHHSRQSSAGNASSIYVDTSPNNYHTRSHSRNSSIISNNDIVRANLQYNNNNNNNKRFSMFNSIDEKSTPIQSKESTPTPTSLAEMEANAILTPSGYKLPSSDRRSVSAKEFQQLVKSKDLSKRVNSEAAAAAIAALSPDKSKKDDLIINSSSISESPQIPPPLQSSKSTLKQKVVGRPSKMQTSAFQEGIRNITPDEAIKDSDYSGYMFKRGSLSIGSWKRRFFTLHKTRLSYYTSMNDSKEKGLIDITSHKVLPATEAEDKLSAVYAATAGYGRYCFKLIPPAPGSRKGLTFTQQKVHYFAVETKEEMREWMSALMKATIELDDTVPAISSCQTPTIPLQKAQEMMAIARENARENFDNLQKMREEQQQNFNNEENEIESGNININSNNNSKEKFEDSRNTYLTSSQDGSSYENDDKSPNITSRLTGSDTPSSTEESIKRPKRVSSIKTKSSLNGMSTPYLMTSGLNSPNVSHNNIDTPARMSSLKVHAPVVTRLDGDGDEQLTSPITTLHASNSFSRRMLSLRQTNKDQKST